MTTFQKVGSGYTFNSNWSGHQIDASISRLMPTRDDGLKAQIAVLMDNTPICRSSPTLTSVSGMDQFWRKLNRRRAADDYGVDWEAWVEELAGRVLDAHRQGQPEIAVADLWDNQSEADIWLVEPYVLQGSHNVLYGDPGTAKSMMALFWAALMDTGHIDSAHGLATSRAHCLYLDWETTQEEAVRRLRWLHEAMGISAPSGVLYRYCTQPLVAEVDYVQDIIQRRWGGDDTPVVIICDSQGLATGGRLVDEEQVISYFAALRTLTEAEADTSLSITHTNKDGGLFGSQYTLAAARNLWEIKRASLSRGQIDVGLFHRKANTVGREGPRAYQLTFNVNPETNKTSSVSIKSKRVMDTEVAPQGLSTPELTYQVVRAEGPLRRDELPGLVAEYKEVRVEKIQAAVLVALSRLLKSGRLLENDGMIQMPAAPTDETRTEPEREGDLWTTTI